MQPRRLSLAALSVACLATADAFQLGGSGSRPTTTRHERHWAKPRPSASASASASTGRRSTRAFLSGQDQAEAEAAALLEKVRRMRAEIADLEGRPVEDVEKEAADKKADERDRIEKASVERAEREEAERRAASDPNAPRPRRPRSDDGRFLSVPVTAEDQVRQAADAVECAFKDGLTRQVVRFALLPEGKSLSEDIQWPGGAQQMYREAAGPLTRDLLAAVRAPTGNVTDLRTVYKPDVTSRDVLDFDGSALVDAQAATGPSDDVRAFVFPNTDNTYSRDIQASDDEMGGRLFMLVNPFWRNLDSWGFNILAPKGKELAQKAIFDRDYRETYVLLRTSVRGEDCVALKAYPYDWQLYAYREDDAWPYGENIIRLGSTKNEPTTAEFAELMNDREEFKMNKNMRQMQRMVNRDE